MAKKCMKKCPPCLVIKGMQIKTTLKVYLTPIRIAAIRNTNDNKHWQGCGGKKEPSYTIGGKVSNHYREQYGGSLKN
jgi:hypothetical protein